MVFNFCYVLFMVLFRFFVVEGDGAHGASDGHRLASRKRAQSESDRGFLGKIERLPHDIRNCCSNVPEWGCEAWSIPKAPFHQSASLFSILNFLSTQIRQDLVPAGCKRARRAPRAPPPSQAHLSSARSAAAPLPPPARGRSPRTAATWGRCVVCRVFRTQSTVQACFRHRY